jgi:hypothetical protein
MAQTPITPETMNEHFNQLTKPPEMSNNKSISAMDLLNRKIETIPCLVEPFLQKVGLACIAGSSDTGKSCFLRYLCMCVVSGESDFLGFNTNVEHKRAIYVSTEDDETAIACLLFQQNKDLNIKPSKLKGFEFIFDTENILKTVDNALTTNPADIVCIDAFTDLYGQNMNESNKVRTFLNEYSQLAQKHKCLILFLHHSGKRKEDGEPSKHNLLGSQGFEAKMRLVMELRADITEKRLKHMCIVKGNYLPEEYKNESFQLRLTDNMTFVNTGERIPFESLSKVEDVGKQKYELIKMYQAQGYTTKEIAEKVGYKSKGSVSKIIQKFETKGDVSKTFPQETEETAEKTRPNNDKKLPF